MPPVATIIAIVAVVAFVAWRAWVAFTPQIVMHPPAQAQQQRDVDFVAQKAREVQGDFTKLSPDDQTKVQQVTHGFGPAAIASTWKKQHSPGP